MAMGVMEAIQIGTLLRALKMLLKRVISASRRGDHHEVSKATKKNSRPFPNNCATPFS